MNKTLLIVITISSIFATVFLSQRFEYFPAQLEIIYHSADTDNITVYFDIGNGFQQRLRQVAAAEKLSSSDSIMTMALPLKKVNRIRLDLDSVNNEKQSIVIEKLCLASKRDKHCWPANELHKNFIKMNAIDSYSLLTKSYNIDEGNPTGTALFVQAKGFDPHFTFDFSLSEAHKKLSGIAKFQYILFAILLTIIFYYIAKLLGLLLPKIIESFLEQKRNDFAIPLNIAAASVALLSIILSGAWLIAFKAGIIASLLMIGGVFFVAILPSENTKGVVFSVAIRLQRFTEEIKHHNILSLSLVVVFCILPVLVYFYATWVQEFPHLGDHEYHLWGNRVSYRAIQHNDVVLLSSLLCLFFAYIFGYLRWALIIIAAVLVSTGAWHLLPSTVINDVQGIFARYPGGSRILAYPFVHLSYQFQWNDPLNTGRLLNVLSVPIWLLILRPLLIGKLPNWEVLAFITLFFWQAEIVYQFSTAYLDIWSIIFILLATEKLIVSQTDIDRLDDQGYLKACLFLSVACAFKEPAIFIIPWFWLAGWSLGVFKANNQQALLKRFYYSCVIGFASVLPFLVYYVVRKSFGISRYTVRGFEYFLTKDWFSEMATRIGFHFGLLGSLMLSLIAILWLVVLVSPIWRAQRWMMICILGALLSQVFLFNWDQGGVAFTGYLRFYLPAIILFFAPVLLISSSRKQLGAMFSKALFLMIIVAFIGNAPTMYAAALTLNEPDSARNFNEHYDAPIYLPIRSLIKTAESAGVLEGKKRAIYINHVTAWNQPAFVYSDLLVKYKLRMKQELKCSCSNETPSVLAPFVNIAGLNERIKGSSINEIKQIPQHQSRYVKRWREINESREMCVAEIKRTCQYSAQKTLKDGTIIGVIGVGVN